MKSYMQVQDKWCLEMQCFGKIMLLKISINRFNRSHSKITDDALVEK